ncbi:MAG TPA: transposase [Phototrophicaceae bacterium]|nr:transposase [Phototrophicaceae bacterium]
MVADTKNRDREGANDGAYLITFTCYGAHLPGQSGSVDRDKNQFGSPKPEENKAKEAEARTKMAQEAYWLDATRRQVLLDSLREVCANRGWALLAAHVRTSHVHIVVGADETPERTMSVFKAYASRALNAAGLDSPERRRWARHGSTRHLYTKDAITAAVHYVVCEQGEPMAVYCAPAAY